MKNGEQKTASEIQETYCLQPEVPLRPLLPLLPQPPSGQLLLHHHLRHPLRRLVLSSTCQLIQPITRNILTGTTSAAQNMIARDTTSQEMNSPLQQPMQTRTPTLPRGCFHSPMQQRRATPPRPRFPRIQPQWRKAQQRALASVRRIGRRDSIQPCFIFSGVSAEVMREIIVRSS